MKTDFTREWPRFLLKARRRISPRYKESDHYSRFIGRICQRLEKPVVLDVGGSSGTTLHRLVKRCNASFFINIDLNAQVLNRCKMRITDVECICCDAGFLPFRDRSIHLIYSVSVLEHVKNIREAVDEQSRIARKIIVFQIPELKYLVEIHTLIPLLGFLPEYLRHKLSCMRSSMGINWQCSVKRIIQLFQKNDLSLVYYKRIYHSKFLKLLLIPLGYFVALKRANYETVSGKMSIDE